MFKISIITVLSLFGLGQLNAQVELGKVEWHRDLDQAVELSTEKDKDIFILFQEVPGCLTCRNYGQNVLSHPLIVEAIETLFIPVAIFNNKKGKDAEALTFFHEPSWNNPVVRIVNNYKQDITDRVNGNYSELGIIRAMISALEKSRKDVPNYLQLLEEEFSNIKNTERAYFSMFCFWTGEKVFGEMDGVVGTEAGFMDGKEVVRVDFNPEVISMKEMSTAADKQSCAQSVYVNDANEQKEAAQSLSERRVHDVKSYRADHDIKYYMSRTNYRFIPMTNLQAARVNSLIGQRKSPDHLLSPRQLAIYQKAKSDSGRGFKNLIGLDLVEAWDW